MMEPEKICENCVYCTREDYCTHREGPYKTWPENHCNNFESKEKDNETMNEELEKKYENMTISDMIEKMEELEENCASYEKINATIARNAADLEVDNYNLRKQNKALDTRNDELLIENREKEAKIANLTQELADKKNQIWRLNEDIAKYCEDTNPKIGTLTARLTYKENQVRDLEKKLEEKNEVIDKMEDQIEELESEVKRKRAIIKDLTEQIVEKNKRIEDKDDVVEDLSERLEHQKHIILNYERDIVRYSKSDEEKRYIDTDNAVAKALANLQKAISTCSVPINCPIVKSSIEEYAKKCEEEAKPKLSYKCCPEIKKLIDDAGYMRDHMERILRGDKSYSLDTASLYPTKFELNPNADCPAYAARMKAKYDSLIKVGFSEDQAMSLLPIWTDD